MSSQARILQAAMELFGRQGFEATSIRQIADRCGLTDAAVLYHFGSKRRILSAIWEELGGLAATRIVEPPSSPLANQVDTLVATILTETARRDPEVRLLVRQTLAGDERAAAARSKLVQSWLAFLEPIFERTYPPATAARMADALMMLIIGCVLKGQIERGPDFPAVCSDPAFRAQVQQLARTVTVAECDEAV